MGSFYLKPSSNLGRETKNPTTFGGRGFWWGDLESAPQNRHGPKAYSLGYCENFSAYELRIHFLGLIRFWIEKGKPFLLRNFRMQRERT
jgi:hypothetical protein